MTDQTGDVEKFTDNGSFFLKNIKKSSYICIFKTLITSIVMI